MNPTESYVSKFARRVLRYSEGREVIKTKASCLEIFKVFGLGLCCLGSKTVLWNCPLLVIVIG